MERDARAIRRIREGDRAAYRELVQRYQAPLLRFLASLVLDRHTAEDLAQEAFLLAYRQLARFDPQRGQFATWLFTLARNLALNVQRRRVKVSPLSDEAIAVPAVADRADQQRAWMQQLDRALHQLPAEQRSAFHLAEVEQLPYAMIAEIEGIAEGTVKSRVSRAKERLRKTLQHLQGELS